MVLFGPQAVSSHNSSLFQLEALLWVMSDMFFSATSDLCWSAENQAGYWSIFDGSVKDCRDWQHIQVR
jgi:hypothetical protein